LLQLLQRELGLHVFQRGREPDIQRDPLDHSFFNGHLYRAVNSLCPS